MERAVRGASGSPGRAGWEQRRQQPGNAPRRRRTQTGHGRGSAFIIEGRRNSFTRRRALVRGWQGTLSGLRVDWIDIRLVLGDDVAHVVRFPVDSGGAKLWIGVTPAGSGHRFGFLEVRDGPSGHPRVRLSVPIPPDDELWMHEGSASTADGEPFVVLTSHTFRVALEAAAAG